MVDVRREFDLREKEKKTNNLTTSAPHKHADPAHSRAQSCVVVVSTDLRRFERIVDREFDIEEDKAQHNNNAEEHRREAKWEGQRQNASFPLSLVSETALCVILFPDSHDALEDAHVRLAERGERPKQVEREEKEKERSEGGSESGDAVGRGEESGELSIPTNKKAHDVRDDGGVEGVGQAGERSEAF